MMLALTLLLCATPLERSAEWMAKFPVDELGFDAAVGLSQVLKLSDSPALRAAFERARSVADRDADHPQRRFWDAGVQVTKAAVATWDVSDIHVNLNRPLDEALWCDVHGLRPVALRFIAGSMRDGGGYRSTHALWALVVARDRGCLDADSFARASAQVRAELRRAQPGEPGPKTADLDLYGERLLFLRLAGERDAELDGWAAKLLNRQNTDGSWGATADRPYAQYHATLVATWALALTKR
jgi:hypothetical protein